MHRSRMIIAGADIYTPNQRINNKSVLIENGKISQISQAIHIANGADIEWINASGLILVPGFIELQINGAFGLDFTAEPESIFQVAEKLPRFGVTSFLPTIVTSPLQKVARAQEFLRVGPPEGFMGSKPLGLHVEGPFLNPERKGAHRQDYLRLPQLKDYEHLSPQTGVRMVTLAPELPGAIELVAGLTRRGIVVSAGHSLASFEQAQVGFQAGIRYATHLFNAMSPLMQFDPGLPGAILSEAGLRFGLIPDGIHVHPALVNLVWKLTGAGRMTLVSDAMAALGMPPGKYVLGDLEVIVDETSARLLNGVLAGSILDHPQALRNLIAFTGCSLEDALTCLTTTPAALLGIDQSVGQIAPGYTADLVLMDPGLHVIQTIIAGKVVYEAKSLHDFPLD